MSEKESNEPREDFETLYRQQMEACIESLMTVIAKDERFKDYVVNFDGHDGFAWDSDPRKAEIYEHVASDGHSGASYALCLRECQRRMRPQ